MSHTSMLKSRETATGPLHCEDFTQDQSSSSDPVFGNRVRVRFTDIDYDSKTLKAELSPDCVSKVYDSPDGVLDALKDASPHRIRIISITSVSTLSPLQITESLMQQILLHYEISAEFLPILYSFGDAPNAAEGSSSNIAVDWPKQSATPLEKTQRARRVSYQIQYFERNYRQGNTQEWSSRQTGLYHRITTGQDVFILLHSTPHTVAELRTIELEKMTTDRTKTLKALVENPMLLHLFWSKPYINNWRWYLRHQTKNFSDTNNPAMAMDFNSLNMDSSANKSFNSIQTLRHFHDQALIGKACCEGNLEVVEELVKINQGDSTTEPEFLHQQSKLRGHVKGFNSFMARIQNAIELLGYAINLKSQLESTQVESRVGESTQEVRDMTREVRDLARKADRDSSSILFLTVIGAFYLPGSFVATVYGMNFFQYNASQRRIFVAKDVWIFPVTWIPLFMLTAGSFFLLVWLDAWRQGRKVRWPTLRRVESSRLDHGSRTEKL